MIKLASVSLLSVLLGSTLTFAAVTHEEVTTKGCDTLIIELTSTYSDDVPLVDIAGYAPATLVIDFEQPGSALIKCVVGIK